jgi:hypothetical protein
MSGLYGTVIVTLIVFPPLTVDVTEAEEPKDENEELSVDFATDVAVVVGPKESFI